MFRHGCETGKDNSEECSDKIYAFKSLQLENSFNMAIGQGDYLIYQ